VRGDGEPGGDLLLLGGAVRSPHDGWRAHEALLIRDGRVAALGAAGEVRAAARPGAPVLDLADACALPGLADAHLHLLGHALAQAGLALGGVPALGALVQAVREEAARRPAGGWIVGRGWDQERWPERRMPTRAELDAAAPRHPVWLMRVCGHVGAANSLALRLAGVGAATIDPPGGAIDRGPAGEPTGVLREAALALVAPRVPRPDAAERARLLERALRSCLALGITQVQTDDADSAGGFAEALALYRRAAGPAGVPVRVTLMIPAAAFAGARAAGIGTGWGDRWLRAGHVKLFADGSLGARTALLREPYADEPATRGIAVHPPEELAAIVREVHRAGSQLGIHAIGDGASHLALDAIAAAQREQPRADHRHRLIHCQVTGADTLRAYRAAGVVADVQPAFVGSDWPWVEARLGPARTATSYAWGSLARLGVPCCGGSDCPIEPLDPLRGIACAVTRQGDDGRPDGGFLAEERLSVPQALGLVTAGAAHATFEEGFRGALAPGFAGDVTVLDRDPFAAAPEELRGLRAVATVVDGRVVHEA
jgi:predicted amidohydrolase YtcJ